MQFDTEEFYPLISKELLLRAITHAKTLNISDEEYQLCELMGWYILGILGEKYGKHRTGLSRNDRLACFRYTSGPQANRIRKDFAKIFKEDFDLSTTYKTNLKAVSYLNVTLNLETVKYQP